MVLIRNRKTAWLVMTRRTIPKTIFKSLIISAAAIYFVIDALFSSLLRPLAKQIANLKVFRFIVPWIASLEAYSTLGLFVIPLVLLEPIKRSAIFPRKNVKTATSCPRA